MSTTDEGSKGMDTTTTTTRDEAIVAQYEADLLSGAVFARHAASARSRFGYEPPCSRRDVARALASVAAMMAQSDVLAQVAIEVRVNLYGTDSQAQAAVWDAIDRAVARGYDDVIGRSGPEGGRYAVRDYTLRERLDILAWGERIAAPFASSVPGVGWCAQRLADREGVILTDPRA